ncbi:hypothetical protein COCOR_04071 [Corallococcus coralloides DSM 2259]|uniref:Uncharacterized protein n=1 Tax=Corallococcus coralloides (strain ATCC 25202 / DSM 2259 / NBRC 100086 / M2) TaxID=1144275 RepID=H8MVU0_CORCM|nr:hypothetical protein [Corallococcus coralloides]AFE05611.1 hypothetical protein COCOR_04071 [Corallococcus coralloides DSM 2259]
MKLYGQLETSEPGSLEACTVLLGQSPNAPLFTAEFTSPQGAFLLQKITTSALPFPLSLYVLRSGTPVVEHTFADKAALNAVLVAESKPAAADRLVILQLPALAPELKVASRTSVTTMETATASRLEQKAPLSAATPAATAPKVEVEFISVPGAVESSAGSVSGYTLEISCPDTVAGDSEVTPIHQDFLLGPTGAFQLTLAITGRISSSLLTFVVRTPNGLPTRLVSPTHLTVSQAAKMAVVKVQVEPFSPNVLVPSSSAPTTRVLKGRLVDPTGRALTRQQIIFQALRGDGTSPPLKVSLAAVTTHSSGNFSVVVPNEPFLGAHAVVSSRPDEELPITLNADGTFPAFTLLVVATGSTTEAASDEDDCACTDPTPRLPGTEELVANESSYSQDIGGSCVNFTVPNRSLEEFSHYAIVRTTDPRGQLVPIREAPAWEWNGDTSDPAGYARHLHRTLRQTLGSKNPLRWDDDASDYELYQAVSLAHGHVLHFKQTFKADGYSMGDLLYSLPLAPGQKKQLVIYDWNREDGASRDEATVAEEGLTHNLSRDRDIDEILSGTVQESMRGGSSAKTRGFSFGLGGAGSGSKNGVAVGLSTGFSLSGGSGTSSAWQDNTRDMTSSLHNRLRDATMQATSSVRSQRSTVVTSAKQGESLSVQTEVVANHNHCHALTIQYFEILRHFVIEQQVVDVQECLFVPLMMSLFTDAKILRWRECLSEHLLYSPETTRGQELRRGFDAMDRIARNYQGTDFPRRVEPSGAVTFLPYSEESIEEFSGELQLRLTLSRPADQADGSIDAAAWATLSHVFLGLDIRGISNLFVKLSLEERERTFQTQHAPALARNFVEQLRFEAILANGTTVKDLRLDCTLLTDYAPGRLLTVSVRSTRTTDIKALKAGVAQQPFTGTPADLKRSQIVGLRLSSPSLSLSGSFAVVDRGTLRYRTPHFSGTLVNNQAIRNDIGFADQIYLPTPMKPEEQRNPWQEDQRLAQQLRDHLNQENLEYYHHAIWCHGITPHRRYMMLDRIHLAQDEFNSIYAQRGVLGRSLASLVENRLLGVAGNSLVFPVARGLNLDPTYEMGTPDQSGSGAMAHASLLEHYQTEAEREGGQGAVFRLSVPTPGVFAEAVRGACNACERIDDTRFWRWEQSPSDEPTAINPVSTDSRYQAPQSTTPTALPQPIVNIQNAPAAPDPSGVGSLLNALTQVSPFANLTGLDQNQQNALAAMTSNQETARAFGEMATKLALSAQSSRNSAVLNEQIDKAFPVARAPAKNQEWKERLLNAQLGGDSQALSSKASPLDQVDLRQTIDAVRASPGMEVDVGPSQVAVRNRSGTRSASSATSTPTVSDEQVQPPTEWPFIEGYSQITAAYPRLTQILESSSVFRQSVIEPFANRGAADYVPLLIEVSPTATNGFDGQCIIEVRDPADTTTPGGTWISLLQLTRELAGFDMARDVRIRLQIAMRGQATRHPGGILLIISHEWALHGLGNRETVLRARSEGWTLKALRDFYITEVTSHQHHRQVGAGTNATYEAVNDELEQLLANMDPLVTVKIKPSYVDEGTRLLPLPARAVAPQGTRIHALNRQHNLYTAHQMFAFERDMEKTYKYNPAHPMNYLEEGTSADAFPWDYLDSDQSRRTGTP